jgi:hypothetical protein
MRPTVKEILEGIRWFSLEARNPRNDGWTQEAYREHLLTIQKNVNEAIANVNEPGAAIPRVVTTVPGEPKWWSVTPAAHAVTAPDIADYDE